LESWSSSVAFVTLLGLSNRKNMQAVTQWTGSQHNVRTQAWDANILG
jgi:hypothetical protein